MWLPNLPNAFKQMILFLKLTNKSKQEKSNHTNVVKRSIFTVILYG